MSKCIKCGSYAFNLYKEDIDQGGLCDVHYWQGRAHRAEALAEQPAQQEPVAWLTDDEREAFERFNETCEDGEGYDVPKTMMRRLAEIGVIHHTSRGIYGITKFGRSLVGYTTPPQRKPQFKEFIKWAGAQGYDCAQTCNSDTGEWIVLNPMTADLWKAWQAAHNIKENT